MIKNKIYISNQNDYAICIARFKIKLICVCYLTKEKLNRALLITYIPSII